MAAFCDGKTELKETSRGNSQETRYLNIATTLTTFTEEFKEKPLAQQ
jgi:hypothetical protein